MAQNYAIYRDDSLSERLFDTYAASEAEALDLFAGDRSGYETFERMCQSATFAEFATVICFPAAH